LYIPFDFSGFRNGSGPDVHFSWPFAEIASPSHCEIIIYSSKVDFFALDTSILKLKEVILSEEGPKI
jgi:hypothetical protein